MDWISEFVATVKLAEKQIKGNLAVFPLLAPEKDEPDYLLLEKALETGTVEISEVGAGTVPNLMLHNKGSKMILIIEGEELVGAKQNRIVNVSLLIPPKTNLIIPVSCVEQGRWAFSSKTFSHGKKIMPANMRREHQEDVRHCLHIDAGFNSDQNKIWNNINNRIAELKLESPTMAMADLFTRRKNDLKQKISGFRPVDGQIGFVFTIGGRIVGLDAFRHAATLSHFFDQLISSYAMDAIDDQQEVPVPPPSGATVRNFLKSISTAKGEIFPAVGCGQVIRFSNTSVSGAALIDEIGLLHLSAFKPAVTLSKRRIIRPNRRKRVYTEDDHLIY